MGYSQAVQVEESEKDTDHRKENQVNWKRDTDDLKMSRNDVGGEKKEKKRNYVKIVFSVITG